MANSTTGIYLNRVFNIEPEENRMMPGVPRRKTYSERLRMGLDCDEVYPGIIIGKVKASERRKVLTSGLNHGTSRYLVYLPTYHSSSPRQNCC